MAHNLFYNEQTEKHSFFSVKEKAWHGLGQIVGDYPTSAEAIRYAGLDYTVEKRPLFTNALNNELTGFDPDFATSKLDVPAFFATVRNDNDAVLGVVGKDYEVVQTPMLSSSLMLSLVVVTVSNTKPQGHWVKVSAYSLPPNCLIISG
jgi:hypothetical protein